MSMVDGRECTKATTCMSQRKRAKADYTDTAGCVHPPRKSKSKTGRLSQLMSIPMDALMEIFGHLHPLDLLHLARTTKALRRVLMHRSSLFVWKASLSTIPGPPECPLELSEPRWASLVFDTHCSFCFRDNISTVDWRLRVRLCTVCTKREITNWDECSLGRDDRENMMSAVLYRRGKRGPEFLIDEYQDIYHQYLSIENLETRQAFLVEQQQRVKRIKEHAKLCSAWASAQAVARSEELERLQSKRYQAIVDKLVALGWGDEIDYLMFGDALTNHKLVKVPQLLTDQIWSDISGTMIKYMEEIKAKRLALELEYLRERRMVYAVNLFQAYKIQRAPFTDVMPEPLDFHAFSPIKELLDQPSDINVDSDSFLHLLPELDDVVEAWRGMILKEFIAEVKVGVVKRSAHLDNPLDLAAPNESVLQRIQLASTVFACIPCTKLQGFDTVLALRHYFSGIPHYFPTRSLSPHTRPLWFPRVLGHRCLTKPRGLDLSDHNNATKLSVLICHRQRWSCKSLIQVDEEACEVAAAIIETCGMDPTIATVKDMDQLDARLECLMCLANPIHIVFGWRSAVKHQRDYHPSDPGHWRMLTAGEAEVARVEERNIGRNTTVPSNRKVWLCLHGLDTPEEESWMTLEEVESHLHFYYDIEEPKVNRDYVKDFAAPELYATHDLFEATMVTFPE